jgi:hypothetical protein
MGIARRMTARRNNEAQSINSKMRCSDLMMLTYATIVYLLTFLRVRAHHYRHRREAVVATMMIHATMVPLS